LIDTDQQQQKEKKKKKKKKKKKHAREVGRRGRHGVATPAAVDRVVDRVRRGALLVHEQERALELRLLGELDRPRVAVPVDEPPLVAHGGKHLEGALVQLDEGLADHGLHLALALLHVHQRGQRHGADNPVADGTGQVPDRRDVAAPGG
jgi:hypothetical protein